MSKNCSICDIETIFFVWSTTRNFPLNKYIKRKGLKGRRAYNEAKYGGSPVCIHCFEELKR
jgi:hypothetical protein